MLHSRVGSWHYPHVTRQERLARGKHSSLLQKFLNYGHRKFYNIWAYSNIRLRWKGLTLTESYVSRKFYSIGQCWLKNWRTDMFFFETNFCLVFHSFYQRWNSLISLSKMEFTNLVIKDGIHQCLYQNRIHQSLYQRWHSPVSISNMEFTNVFMKDGIHQSHYQRWNSPMSKSKIKFTNVFIKDEIHQCVYQKWNSPISLLSMVFANSILKMKFTNVFVKDEFH